MRKLWLLVSCLTILVPMLASCGTAGTTTPTTAATGVTTSTVPTTVEKVVPQSPMQGGTLVLQHSKDPQAFDPYYFIWDEPTLWLETLAERNLATDRAAFSFRTRFVPSAYWTGALAESWDVSPDMSSFTFHIRKGIRWQNIPPVNGREFTANDVEYNYHRQLGLGSGFTKISPNVPAGTYAPIASVTATDKYTVVFKLKAPSLQLLISTLISETSYGYMIAPEAVQKWGDLNAWDRSIGTGPFVMKDFVSSSSLIVTRNNGYWQSDSLHPENRQPYVDQVKILIIPDLSTAQSALRTGKLDLLENSTWETAQQFQKSNPELLHVPILQNDAAIALINDKPPYNDLRVRKAMQMAVDNSAIAKDYLGGVVDATPFGVIGPAFPGSYTPYSDWPEDVKEGYIYNPEKAKKLLAEAGYPSGFKCVLTASSVADLDLYQILINDFAAVGINMSLNILEPASFSNYTMASKHEMMTIDGIQNINPPAIDINYRSSYHRNYALHHIKDPVYDDLYQKIQTSLDEKEIKQLVIKADMRAITQHFFVDTVSKATFSMYQPWLKNYTGENSKELGNLCSWVWIDQDMKKAMGK